MSENRVRPLFEETYTIPGKLFVLGEYAVLAGLPALVAAVGPRFQMTVKESHLDSQNPSESNFLIPHPESPIAYLGRWAAKMGLPDVTWKFEDPWVGAGGFGASTAQFAMAYLAYVKLAQVYSKKNTQPGVQFGDRWFGDQWNDVWNLYRELMAQQNQSRDRASWMTPSGADLVGQWQGGVAFFDPAQGRCEDLSAAFDGSKLLLFSATGQAGRKVATHEHLEALSKRGFPQNDCELVSSLQSSIRDGVLAVRKKDSTRLGLALDHYAEALRKAGLEVPATFEDRKILRSIPGVLGVKGAGALQSDAVLVLVEGGSPVRQKVIEIAESRNLCLVSDGLTHQMGVLCLNS